MHIVYIHTYHPHCFETFRRPIYNFLKAYHHRYFQNNDMFENNVNLKRNKHIK